MLRRMNEKKETVNDEAYYLLKIEELRKRNDVNAKPTLIVQEGSDEDIRVEVWSIDFVVDEVRKPTHGGCFVAKSDFQDYEGRCLMVQNVISKQGSYANDSGKASENCFAAKPVSE